MAFAVVLPSCVNLAPPWENAPDSGGGSGGTVAVGGAGGSEGDAWSFDGRGGAPDATKPTQLDGGIEVGRQVVDLAVNDTAVADAPLGGTGGSTFDGGTGGTGGGGSTDTGTATKTTTGTQTATSTESKTSTSTSTSTHTATSTSTSTTTITNTRTNTTTSAVTQTCASTSYDAKTLKCTDGNAESDGWYIIGSSNFLWAGNLAFAAGTTTMTVVARGDYVSGAWPIMQVTAEGEVIGTVSVASTTMTDYVFTFTASATTAGSFGVQVASGVGLHVKSVTFSCPTTTATVTATITSTGTATAAQTASAIRTAMNL
jgi:chitinase